MFERHFIEKLIIFRDIDLLPFLDNFPSSREKLHFCIHISKKCNQLLITFHSNNRIANLFSSFLVSGPRKAEIELSSCFQNMTLLSIETGIKSLYIFLFEVVVITAMHSATLDLLRTSSYLKLVIDNYQ